MDNNISIKDFYNYYINHCTKNCLDEMNFNIEFSKWWMFIQNSHNIREIPILKPDGTSYWLIEENIIQKVKDFKNANK